MAVIMTKSVTRESLEAQRARYMSASRRVAELMCQLGSIEARLESVYGAHIEVPIDSPLNAELARVEAQFDLAVISREAAGSAFDSQLITYASRPQSV